VDSDPILVVGGRTGIGAAIAARYGDRSVVWSRQLGVDATDEAQVAAAAARLLERSAPFAWIHAVGDFDERPGLEADLNHCRHMLDSNFLTAVIVARAVLPAMLAARRGRVVLFGVAGLERGSASMRAPIYYAAKAALLSFARSLSVAAAPAGVTVNVISPGIIRHAHSHAASQERMLPRVPLGGAGTVRDVLPQVELLLGEGGRYVTGAHIEIDGGLGRV
jgi:NAD(P)-dependent dehydrogenase (short-subunit alcohol dehydrogenase family)